jgi:hypothetical protein
MKNMADEKNAALPTITTKNWWGIRKKMKATMPRTVTKSFVAAALSIQEASAQTNVISPMTQMGLLDDGGAPTALANDWRDDAKYARACGQIREAVYPRELLDLAPDSTVDRDVVKKWIAGHRRVGDEAARQAAAVYMLLVDADPSKESGITRPQSQKSPSSAAKQTKPSRKQSTSEKDKDQRSQMRLDTRLQINIQVHIAADTTPEQIDKIFASMAKHLKDAAEQ